MGDCHVYIKKTRQTDSVPGQVIHVRLVGRNLSTADDVFELRRTTTLVGRGKDAGITLVDPSVSRIHGRIMIKPDGTVIVEDTGSSNGIFVNDRRIKVWQISEGDLLRFGNVEFAVEIPTADTMETAAVGGFLARLMHAAGSNLAWVIASIFAILIIVLLVTLLPAYLERNAGVPALEPPSRTAIEASDTASQQVEEPVTVETKKPKHGPLEEAEDLLVQKRIDEAASKVEEFIGNAPTDARAVRLKNIITLEREAESHIASSIEAITEKDYVKAANALMEIPDGSLFSEQRDTQLTELKVEIDRTKKRACLRKGRKSVGCIRFSALLKKIERTVER